LAYALVQFWRLGWFVLRILCTFGEHSYAGSESIGASSVKERSRAYRVAIWNVVDDLAAPAPLQHACVAGPISPAALQRGQSQH
jgi:hypothetical protein